MLIRAVGRAAFYIIKECRIQFRDKEIWAGTKKPNYARVVNICTNAAQSELIGPGLLAVLSPILVGVLLGPYALGGFLAGMIVSGVMLGVFMANAGGAWDNAKKMIEDEPKDPARNLGKGSEKHKAAVTGDTVGDPLKDTAGPAINPLVKVMNMVAMLTLTSVVLAYNMAGDKTRCRAYGARRLDRRHHCHRLYSCDRVGRQEVERRIGRDERNPRLAGRRQRANPLIRRGDCRGTPAARSAKENARAAGTACRPCRFLRQCLE